MEICTTPTGACPVKKQERALERYALQRGDDFVLLKVEPDKAKLPAR